MDCIIQVLLSDRKMICVRGTGLFPRSSDSIPKKQPECNKTRNKRVTNLQQFTIANGRKFMLAFFPKQCYHNRIPRRRETAADIPFRELPVGARQRKNAVIRPGAGDEESPGRAPYSAFERRGFSAQAGWQRGKLPSQWLGLEDFFILNRVLLTSV